MSMVNRRVISTLKSQRLVFRKLYDIWISESNLCFILNVTKRKFLCVPKGLNIGLKESSRVLIWNIHTFTEHKAFYKRIPTYNNNRNDPKVGITHAMFLHPEFKQSCQLFDDKVNSPLHLSITIFIVYRNKHTVQYHYLT